MAVRFPARSELRCQDTDWPNIPELIAGSSYFSSFQAIQGCVFAHCQDVHDNSTTCHEARPHHPSETHHSGAQRAKVCFIRGDADRISIPEQYQSAP